LLLKNVGLNKTRDGIIHVLQAMGADLSILDRRLQGGEDTGDIRVRYSGRLRGIEIPLELIPSLIDELPVILALAAVSDGTTSVRGAAELRVKESDRLSVMARGLAALGVSLQEYEDGVDIQGGEIQGGRVDGSGDHRCAMSFAVLGQVAAAEMLVAGSENIDTSYPGFVRDLSQTGGLVRVVQRGSVNVRKRA
jgi:3-phosphoshikimate 1-carboxyvinyltransferase